MQKKSTEDIKEKIKNIISIILNSKDSFGGTKIINKNDYRKLCNLLGITNIEKTIRNNKSIYEAYMGLSKIIDSYPELFSIYNITTVIKNDPSREEIEYKSYYGDKLILFQIV
jgi:hypothetical protein